MSPEKFIKEFIDEIDLDDIPEERAFSKEFIKENWEYFRDYSKSYMRDIHHLPFETFNQFEKEYNRQNRSNEDYER